MSQPQTYKNHGRFEPKFHFFVIPILLLNIAASIIWYIRHRPTHIHSGPWIILLSIALFVLAGMARDYALKGQDRIIRLEERLRIASLVTASELVELESLTMRQYTALRFASNPELPELARRAIRENLTNKQIKEAIVVWRPDNHRI
jgi:hypothetical protein